MSAPDNITPAPAAAVITVRGKVLSTTGAVHVIDLDRVIDAGPDEIRAALRLLEGEPSAIAQAWCKQLTGQLEHIEHAIRDFEAFTTTPRAPHPQLVLQQPVTQHATV